MKSLFRTCHSFILFLCSCWPTTNSQAQQDSIREQILRHAIPNNELIYRGRRMIVDKIVEGDRQKVWEVMNYLIDSAEDKDHIAFYPVEKWLLYFWAGNYAQVLSDSRHFESFLLQAEGRRVPIQDALGVDVNAKVTYDRLRIQQDIKNSDFTDVEKAFLVLNLDFLTERGGSSGYQESINQACNGFMLLFPNSEFEPYIRKYLRYQYTESKWAGGFELFSGYSVLTGEMSSKFTNLVPLGVAVDVSYKKFILYLRIYGGLGLTRDSIVFANGTWEGDAQLRAIIPEASIGYTVYSNRSVEIAPFVGIGSMGVDPTKNDKDRIPEYEFVGLKHTGLYLLGVNVDVTLQNSGSDLLGGFGQSKSKIFLRLRYTYTDPGFEKTYPGFSGDFHSLTIGIGILSRQVKRDH